MDIRPSATPPPIDLTRLQEWVPDPNALARLVEVYLAESRRALAEVKAGVLDGNARRVHDATHSWKTSNAWLGCDVLVQLCLEIERTVRIPEFRERGTEVVARMREAFEAVQTSLATLTTRTRNAAPPSASIGEAQ